MLDPAVVDECTRLLAGAALYEGTEADVMLTAAAFARDLADTHSGRATGLLDTAARQSAALVRAAELEIEPIAAALQRLAAIRHGVETILPGLLATTAAPQRLA
jgi:hypothetical protein